MHVFGINPILNCDGYCPSHWAQMPPGTKATFAYIESRGGRWPETCVFGLQAFVRAYLTQPITHHHVDEARHMLGWYAPGTRFNEAGFRRIVDVHGGHWPVEIRAVPEGSVVPTGHPLVTIESTDALLPWVPGYIEAPLLRATWYGTTVATESFQAKRIIKRYVDLTCDDPEAELPWKLHDFGARAASSFESAGLGGMAHLVNFNGTDTVSGILAAQAFYRAGEVGGTIPASAHYTMTPWGREGEVEAYRNMIRQHGGKGAIFACVSDAYNIWHAVEELWGGELRREVIDSGATVVIRPDSGDPVQTPIAVIEMLAERFGFTVNRQGFKVLNHVRVIQGDGVEPRTIEEILGSLYLLGYSASNITFGMGGKLLQSGIDRDTQKFAQKQSAVHIDERWIDTYKDPVDDPGKASKRGLLGLAHDNDNGWQTIQLGEDAKENRLNVVYQDGWLPEPQRFADVRARAAAAL